MMKQPRISPVEDLDPEQREIIEKTLAGPEGEYLRIFTTLAHHPGLLKRFNVLGGFFLTKGDLSGRDRELVILRTGWHTRSLYEFAQHTPIAEREGITAQEIEMVAQPALADEWSDRDRALLAFTDDLLENVNVSDESWSAAARYLNRAEMLELTMLVGFYRMVAGFLNTAGVVPDPWLPGWPDGRAPA